MKPIKLKIKGLNSFIDNQEVDFIKLTDRGMFGIFGPTGSGKSTILDGITLALYGEVARKSSNFMNTNCDSLNVSFEFQISGKEIKKYRVDREFRRENKTGSVRSKSAKIVDISGENEEVLEDKVKEVTAKCEEIIGLQLDDFTRTVVLPQGKFSEFLKLEGKPRRDMLERLFNLQKYGDELSFKLTSKIKKEKQNENVLIGELKGYEDINETIAEEKRRLLTEITEQIKKSQAELKEAEDNFNKGKDLWELQSDLKRYVEEQNKLNEKKEEITESEIKVTLGNSSLKVRPYIDSYENTIGRIVEVDNKLQNLFSELDVIAENKSKLENILNEAKVRKDKELPELKIKEQKVIDAIEEKGILNSLLLEKEALQEGINKAERSLLDINDKIKENENNINLINKNITDKEGKVESLKVPEEYKIKVNEGIVILSKYENLEKQKDKFSTDIETVSKNIENVKMKTEKLSAYNKEAESLLLKNKEALEKLEETCPGDQNSLLTLQENLTIIRNKWNKYGEYTANLAASIKNIEELTSKFHNKKKEISQLEQEINVLDAEIKNIQVENLAHTLREALLEGEPCPVCGSREHNIDNIKITDSNNLEQLKSELSNKEKKKKALIEEIIQAQTKIKTEEANIDSNQVKINGLGDEFKAISVESLENKFNKLKADIETYNSEKAALEKREKELKEKKNAIEINYGKGLTIIDQSNAQLIKLQEDFKASKEEFEKINSELLSLKSELGIEDFKIEREKINKIEKEKTALEKDIRTLRDNLKLEQDQKEILNKKAGEYREEVSNKKATLIEKNRSIEEKENSIRNKVGDVEDLKNFKENISREIQKIVSDYDKAEKDKNEAEVLYNECNNNIISAQTDLNCLKERSIKDKEKLEVALKEEGFKNIEEAKSNYLAKEQIDKLRIQIEEYKNSFAKLAGTIENLEKKIGGRSLTEEQWNEIQTVKTEKAKAVKELEESKIKLVTEVETINKKLTELKKLLKRKEELDYKLGLLDDLEKLFKGKKFVEFVAANQLKYVSIEASRRLKEITGGNYGLEVDGDGKFFIRDYKNGGAKRDASTLSGGETFIASLALALALSAQIQLKGTAPLELFFLDEGFGTLDDNLLEVVMDSLEKIHNDRLSIGIISHVESIKNRVPVKLIVSAAEAGMGGSKVRIERS